MTQLDQLQTEQANPRTADIDRLDTLGVLERLNDEDQLVAPAVRAALPRVARAVSSNPDAYVYLAESIRAWPDQTGLAGRLADAGWSDVEYRNLSGGIVALHRAIRD